jgi:hypothetical protein
LEIYCLEYIDKYATSGFVGCELYAIRVNSLSYMFTNFENPALTNQSQAPISWISYKDEMREANHEKFNLSKCLT